MQQVIGTLGHARAMAMIVLTTASAAITASLTRLGGRTARIVVAATMAVSFVLVQTPGLAVLLHLEPLHADDWMLAIGGGLLAALVVSAASLRRQCDTASTRRGCDTHEAGP